MTGKELSQIAFRLEQTGPIALGPGVEQEVFARRFQETAGS